MAAGLLNRLTGAPDPRAPHWKLSALTGDEARRAYSRLRRDAPTLSARISHVKDGAGWTWVLQSPSGTPLARSVRSHERYATCQIAVAKFLALLAADA